MFHHHEPITQPSSTADPKLSENKPTSPPPVLGAPKQFTLNQVGELLEKNLKWSQIIYEQNRKINRKLFISSLFGWIYFIIIVAPLILAVWFLPPIFKNLYGQYQGLLGGGSMGTATSQPVNSSLDQILKLLPLDAARQEQLKALLK